MSNDIEVIEAVDVLVNEFVNDDLAPNYKGWVVKDMDSDNEYVITVQLNNSETPSEQLAAANEEIAALKTYASKGDEEIKSLDEQLDAYEKAIAWHVNHTNKMHKEIAELSPLVEIASNQKQRIQQMEEQLAAAKAEIADMDRVFERANNANQRLLTKAYGEIAEYRDFLESIKRNPTILANFQILDEKLGELLAKHKGNDYV